MRGKNEASSPLSFPSETVSQCHPEAVAEGSAFCTNLESLDSSPTAQNDIRVGFSIATQSLKGEEVSEITAGDKSIGFRLSSAASPCASLCDA